MSEKINPLYRKQIEQIRLDAEDYSDSQMQNIYNQQNKKLDDLHAFIGLLFIKYATDGLLKLTSQQKSNITKNVDVKLTKVGKDLVNSEVPKVSDTLKAVYKDTYYKNAYVLDSGMDINLKFDMLKDEFIDNAISTEFKGSTFSDRIWANKDALMSKLKQSIIDATNGNTTIDKIGKQIKDQFGVSAYESRRLVRTEVARQASQAQEQIGINAGCKQVMWSATLEGNTCDECAELDGKTWAIEDSPDCPEHPLCRCCLINVPFDNWKPSQRMDNETHQLIDYQDYSTWSKNKGISNDAADD